MTQHLLVAAEQQGLGLPSAALVELGPDGRLIAANAAYCALLRATPDQLVGRTIEELTHPDDVLATRAVRRGLGQGAATPTTFEKRLLRSDGTYVWVRITAIACSKGHMFGHTVDIDELVSARKEAETARQRCAALVAHSADMIVVIDAEARVVSANPAAERLLGMTAEQVRDRSMLDLIHPDDAAGMLRKFADTLSTPGPHAESVFRIRRVDGTWLHLATVTTNCLDDPAVNGMVVNGRDVGEALDSIRSLVSALDRAVEYRDPYTAGHQSAVSRMSGRIARRLALYPSDVMHIELGAALHDIGKIAVPLEILTRPGRLSPVEMELMRSHCQVGYEILHGARVMEPVSDIVLHHHERLDGSGYPHGLSGEELDIGVRIVAVADVVDAMSSHRPYRPSRGVAAAAHEITSHRGVRYDDEVVEAALAMLAEDAQPPDKGAAAAGEPLLTS